MNIHLLTKDYRGIIKVVWNNQQWKSFILWNLSWIEAIFGFAFVSISWDVFEWLNFGEYEKKYWCQDVRIAEAVVTKQFDQQRLNMEWKGSYCTLLHFVWPLVWWLVWDKSKPYALFVFLKSDFKQNARSLLTPVSDPAFHAHGSLSFALHGSFFNHFLIGQNSSK